MLIQDFKLYDHRDDVTLTAFVINETGELRAQGPRPAVIICPGGGYFGWSDREAEPIALCFNAMGYHAFVLRYSTYLQGEGDKYPEIFTDRFAVKPETAHPAPVREIGMTMLLMGDHAEEWAVDMDRVAVCGFSAGAHNAAMYGVYWDKPLLTDYLHVQKEKLRPAAMILGYMVSDYVYMKQCLENTNVNAMNQLYGLRSASAFLGKEDFSEGELAAVSPNRLVTEATPPAFLWATSADGFVPVQHTLLMAKALADAGVPFDLHVYEAGDHGLALGTQASAIAANQLDGDAAHWIQAAGRWLQKRFALQIGG